MAESQSGPGEFTRGWPVLAAAALGLTAGISATMFYSLGAFIPALEAEFGWSRAEISLAAIALTGGIFLAGVPAGRFGDRLGAARVGAISLVLFALTLLAMTQAVGRIEHFLGFYFVIALLGIGTTPIVMIRPIAASFDQRRGLAMGIALTGVGIAGFWVPPFVTVLIEREGWREAYAALAAVALVAAPVVWFGLRHEAPRAVDARASAADEPGVSGKEAIGSRQFWLLTTMTAMMALGVGGLVVHLIPLFRDLGADPSRAAGIASLLGLASTAGRLLIGYLLDRLEPRLVTLGVLTLAAVGALVLWAGGLVAAPVAVLLLGLAAGAEVDLVSYLTSRAFGARAYSTIYGWLYSIFALGFGLSPFLVGRVRDATGNYDLALLAGAALVALAGLVALRLGRLRYARSAG